MTVFPTFPCLFLSFRHFRCSWCLGADHDAAEACHVDAAQVAVESHFLLHPGAQQFGVPAADRVREVGAGRAESAGQPPPVLGGLVPGGRHQVVRHQQRTAQ